MDGSPTGQVPANGSPTSPGTGPYVPDGSPTGTPGTPPGDPGEPRTGREAPGAPTGDPGPGLDLGADPALVRRPGAGATLITYGPSVPVCLEAAEAARAEGWDLEVVDLRSL
ncbi:transketolase C-terminal domain-containing protein, partial [Streptomyces sp. CBMA370]|uniref:transketolase C-terminal domain-containing protein n=1 Tax=Streptomyces sp. CBMA370 TaxID=1930278 RepID=UPI002948C2B7